MCLSCVRHEPPPILTLISETGRTTAARAMCDAGPVFANKAGIARRIECRDRQRRSQHLDEPAYPSGPPNVGRSPCVARFASSCGQPMHCAGQSAGKLRALSAASRVRLGPSRVWMLGAKKCWRGMAGSSAATASVLWGRAIGIGWQGPP
jgi:hypothetical protein